MKRIVLALGLALTFASSAQAEEVAPLSRDIGCMAQLMVFRSAASKVEEDTSRPADRREQARKFIAQTDEAIAWYLGRISLQPETTDLKGQGSAAFGAVFDADKDQQAKDTMACLTEATEARLGTARRFKTGE